MACELPQSLSVDGKEYESQNPGANNHTQLKHEERNVAVARNPICDVVSHTKLGQLVKVTFRRGNKLVAYSE